MHIYSDAGQQPAPADIAAIIAADIAKKYTLDDSLTWNIQQVARQLCDIAAAIRRGAYGQQRPLFLHIEKPDSRRTEHSQTWYMLYFVNGDGRIEKLWPGCDELAKFLGMKRNNRNMQLHAFVFAAAGIGHDRASAALETVQDLLHTFFGIKMQFEGRHDTL